jgi:APA family basic amino acid/polyamine antiporter
VQLLVINSGGIAFVAMVFAGYTVDAAGAGEVWIKPLAVAAIVLLSGVNAAGLRFGVWIQNTFTILKLAALATLVAAGVWLWVRGQGGAGTGPAEVLVDRSPILAMGTALVPVLFSYGGWQFANNIAEEITEPERRIPRALLVGVALVVVVYVAANLAYVLALGPSGLAGSTAPAAETLRFAAGPLGGLVIAVGVAFSTFGLLNIFILGAPRIYQAMAADGLFFESVARLHPRTHTPVVGIWIQAVWAVALLLSGSYGQLLDWVVFGDWIFFGAIATTVFVFRRRSDGPAPFSAPAYPVLPALFVAASAFAVLSSVVSNPRNAVYGTALILAGVPAFLFWRGRRRG